MIDWLNEKKIPFELEVLDIGDIIIARRGADVNTISGLEDIYIIERKTISDMLSSIKDGRYKEQKARLVSNLNNKGCKDIFYILEGYSNKINASNKKTLYGSWISCQFRDKLNVIRTINVEETCEFILRLLDRLKSNPNDFINKVSCSSNNENNNETNVKTIDINYLKTLKTKKKDNLTPNMCQQLALATIPNISTNVSKVIIDKYNGLTGLFREYNKYEIEKDKEEMLANIQINEKRKLGNVASKKIYEFLVKNNN